MKKALYLTVFLAALSLVSHAQEPPNFDDNPPEGVSVVPVDGGAGLLALAGLGYARRRFNKAKAAKK